MYAEHSKFREAARRTRAEAGDKAPDMPSFESEQGFGSPVKKTHPALKHIGEAYTACGTLRCACGTWPLSRSIIWAVAR